VGVVGRRAAGCRNIVMVVRFSLLREYRSVMEALPTRRCVSGGRRQLIPGQGATKHMGNTIQSEQPRTERVVVLV
jgi:hypothetical protein